MSRCCFYCGDVPRAINMGFDIPAIEDYFKTGKLKAFWTCKKCEKNNYLTETNISKDVEEVLRNIQMDSQ